MSDDQPTPQPEESADYVIVCTDELGKVKVNLGYGPRSGFDTQEKLTLRVSPHVIVSQYGLSAEQFIYIQEHRETIEGHLQEEVRTGLTALIKKLQEGGD